MNNLLSVEWLSEFVELEVAQDELAKRLSLTGAGVEHVYPQGVGLENIVVGKIVSLEKHPNADSLTVCQVDVGAKALSQIVCGGSNLFEGQLVAVAVPGARVQWHGEGAHVEIGHTQLRGVDSAGMICASNEIGLGDLLPAADRVIVDLSFVKTKPGTPVADALNLGDTFFDIEATTNRPDLMSVFGIAREAVAAHAAKFKKQAELKIPKSAKLALAVAETSLCPRYVGVQIDGVTVGESPWWMRRRLAAAGVRSVNNIVDITNYVRLELGQPMHAFDANFIENKITVRRAHDGEAFLALDDSKHKLTKDMLVIADDVQVLAVAGVMGGKDSGVYGGTTSVIFEAAAFDSVSVRRTARALNLYSDSQLLFEKGLSAQAPEIAMARAVQLALEIAGGTVVAVADVKSDAYKAPEFSFDFDSVEPFLGEKIPSAEMKRILTSLGFEIKGASAKVTIKVPWWRDHDIEAPVDFIEEIARVYGYHNLPSHLPQGAIPRRKRSAELDAEKELRLHFAEHGYHETYTYSFVNEQQMRRAGLEKMDVVKIQNPLSSDFTLMRPAMLPSMLTVIAENEANFPEGKIFEVSNVYHPVAGEYPHEELRAVACVWSAPKSGEQFASLKGATEQLLLSWGLPQTFDYVGTHKNEQLHPGRSVRIAHGEHEIGWIGEVHPLILKNFGISGRVAFVDISVQQLLTHCNRAKHYTSPRAFPSVKRDIAFVVDEHIAYHIVEEILRTFDLKLSDFELFDIFRDKTLGAGKKSLAFHLTYCAPDRTLTAEEVEEVHATLIKELQRNVGAEMRA